MTRRRYPVGYGRPMDAERAQALMDQLQAQSCCNLWALNPRTLCRPCRARHSTWMVLSLSAGPDSRMPLCDRCGRRHYPGDCARARQEAVG